MLDTAKFIRKVIAPEENLVLWINQPTRKRSWNESYDTLDALLAAISKYDDDPSTTPYLAVGTHHNNIEEIDGGRFKVRRTQETATKFKSLAVDIDVGEKYEYDTQKEAATALLVACKALDIPFPMVISSGNGVHAWWPFDKCIGRDTWVKMSSCLQVALQSKGVKVDASKIRDPSMVLRAVGTHHKKDPDNWKPVRVVRDAPARPVMELAKPLSVFKEAVAILGPNLSKKKQEAKSAVFDALVNSGRKVPLKDLTECPQLCAIMKSRGQTDAMGNRVLEPLWRASLGVAKFTENPRLAAYAMSSGHPDYDEADTAEKMEGWKGTGPTTCASFESNCPGGCDTCQHKGQIVSPAQIERGVPEVAVECPKTGSEQTIELPRGYVRKDSGLFYNSAALDEEVFVCAYFMWVDTRITNMDESRNDARVMVHFPAEGVKAINLDASIIAAGGNDLRKELAAKQVYIKEDIDPVRKYLMTYLRRLQQTTAAEATYGRYGWQRDGSFLCGTGLLGETTGTVVHFSGVIKDMNEHVCTKGNANVWKQATRMLDLKGLEPHNFAVTAALAAPLLKATGTPSLLVNLYSPDSGSGKTTAGRMGLAAWGNPDTMPLSMRDTENAMYKKLGTYSCFGAYIDELTQKSLDPVAVRRLVMTLQSGVEPERLQRSAESFRDKAKWWQPVISSSNHDLHELLRAHQVSSEAEQLRLFQLDCPRTGFFEGKNSGTARKVNRALSKNFGYAGPEMAAAIIAEGGPDALIERYNDEFEAKYNFLGQERFFYNLLLCVYIAEKLISKYGIAGYDPQRGLEHAYSVVLSKRQERDEQVLGGLDIVFQYMTENQDNIVYYHVTPSREFAVKPTPRKAVARVELELDQNNVPTAGMVWLNKPSLVEWCKDNGIDSRHLSRKLFEDGVTVKPYARRALYKGVVGAAAVGQTYCLGLDVMSHPRLIAAASGQDDSAFGRQRLEAVVTDLISSEQT